MTEKSKYPSFWSNRNVSLPIDLHTKFYKKYLSIDACPLFFVSLYGTPVHLEAFKIIESFGVTETLLDEVYSRGFEKGYNSLIPFIDTPEARKEVVMKEINSRFSIGFPMKLDLSAIAETGLEDYGYKVGRLFKAWEIVFQTPNIFSNTNKHKVQKERTNQKKIVLSYTWPHDTRSLNDLHNKLVDGYFEKSTSIQSFETVFNGKGKKHQGPTLKWLQSNRLLAYLLEELFNDSQWQAIAGNGQLFRNCNNKLLSANDLTNAKSGYMQEGKPKGYERIDRILSSVKKP
jgi:hypothetical protein